MLFNLCFFLSLMLIIFIAFYIVNNKRLKTRKRGRIVEINYVVSKFHLDKKKLNYKALVLIISLTNAFIISFVCTIISIIPVKLIWQMLIGFVLLFVFIMLFYELIGIMCVKKGWIKNGSK